MTLLNQKRKSNIIEVLNNASEQLMYIKDDEEEAMENTPESLHGTERYERMEGAIDFLSETIEMIDQCIESAYNI